MGDDVLGDHLLLDRFNHGHHKLRRNGNALDLEYVGK